MTPSWRETPSGGCKSVASLAVERAGTFDARLRGLLGRASLPADHALWLVPSTSVHTFGMRFPIDAVFLDRELRIVAIRRRLAPRRIAYAHRAHSVVELAAGQAGVLGLRGGDRWQFCAGAIDGFKRDACVAETRGRGKFLRETPAISRFPSSDNHSKTRVASLAARLLIGMLFAVAHPLATAQSSAPFASARGLPPAERAGADSANPDPAMAGPAIVGPAIAGPAADRERAELDYRNQRYRSAAQALRRLAQAAPDDARLWLRLGNALEQDGDSLGAASAYESAAAVALPPQSQFGFLEARHRRGKALLNLARLRLLQSQQVLAEYQRNQSAHREHGDVAAEASRHAGRLDEAIGRLAADAVAAQR